MRSDQTIVKINMLKTLAPKWFKNKSVNLVSIITLVMGVIEKFSSLQYLDGEDKLNTVLDFLPVAIDVLSELHLITLDQASSLKNQVENERVLIKDIINTIVDVSNNPNFIQYGKWVKGKILSCFKC